ncbi:MAG: hypothetical protein D3924_13870 [Candidatus Electrothrix sp. AR4]|nr:hypothetical protein [Candidatus Electrothrix sp. AR4]
MSIVDTLYTEYLDIVSFLNVNTQPSLSSDTDRYFKKIIVLSSASFFEHEIQNILITFIKSSTNDNVKIINLLKKKAIGGNYHTFFAWGEKNNPDKPGKNANVFFSLFGDDFKNEMKGIINNDILLPEAIKSFLEIGHLRNILVHSNFAAYNLDNKTTEEIYELHKRAVLFVEFIRKKLK